MRRTLALSLLSLLSAFPSWGEAPWKLERREADGLVVESRKVPESDYPELRVSGRVKATAEALATAAWTWRPDGVEGRMVERRLVLVDQPDSKLVYQLMRPPMVSRRESLLRMERQTSADGVISIQVHSDEGELPEQHSDAVRVPLVRISWRLEPDGAGGASFEYRCLSEPGGGVPAWLAFNTQLGVSVDIVRDVVAFATR